LIGIEPPAEAKPAEGKPAMPKIVPNAKPAEKH